MTASHAAHDVVIKPSDIAQLKNQFEGWEYLPQSYEFKSMERAVEYYLSELARKTDTVYGDASGWICGLRKVEWDSNHFELPIGQLDPIVSPRVELSRQSVETGTAFIGKAISAARECGLEHLSAFIDTRDALTHACLQQCRFQLMDSLVTYWLKAKDIGRVETTSHVRPCEERDLEKVAEISAQCFSDRHQNVNRFNTDPALSQERVKELYRMSIRNSFNKRLADEVLVYELDGQPVGFMTLQKPANDATRLKVGRIPLNAVSPQYQGKGIYGNLVDAGIAWFIAQGCEIIEIKTQIPNTGVHIVWAKLGARLINSSYRFRALMSDQDA